MAENNQNSDFPQFSAVDTVFSQTSSSPDSMHGDLAAAMAKLEAVVAKLDATLQGQLSAISQMTSSLDDVASAIEEQMDDDNRREMKI